MQLSNMRMDCHYYQNKNQNYKLNELLETKSSVKTLLLQVHLLLHSVLLEYLQRRCHQWIVKSLFSSCYQQLSKVVELEPMLIVFIVSMN